MFVIYMCVCVCVIQVEISWVVTTCSVMVEFQHFGGISCLHLQGEVTSTCLFTVVFETSIPASIYIYIFRYFFFPRRSTTAPYFSTLHKTSTEVRTAAMLLFLVTGN